MKPATVFLSWDNRIPEKYYLIVDVTKKHLHLFNMIGYNVMVSNYPKNIENYFDSISNDIFFIKRDLSWFHSFCIKVYDKDYNFTKGIALNNEI